MGEGGSCVKVERVSLVIPVGDVREAARRWRSLLGLYPTHVVGDSWAQFEVGGTRIALSRAKQPDEAAGLLIRVADVGDFRAAAGRLGLGVTEVEAGPDQRGCALADPAGVPVTFYAKPAR